MRRLLVIALACWVWPVWAQMDVLLRSPLGTAVQSNDARTVSGLLANGTSPNSVDLDNVPVLILAAKNGNAEIVDLLLRTRGVNVDIRDRSGDTALHWAARRGFADVVQTLVRGSVGVNLDNRQGSTALIEAAREGHVGVVEVLLAAKADLARQDYTGRTALSWAQTNSRRQVAEQLRRAGAPR